MLRDYIVAYVEASKSGDVERMHEIERDVYTFGMDKATLLYLTKVMNAERNMLRAGGDDRL